MNAVCSPEPLWAHARPSLLIVDDDIRLRRLIAWWCAERQFDVHCAGDGVEAVRLLPALRLDVVLTDFRMPGMNGLELAAWMRKNRPEVAVCLMSSDPLIGDGSALEEFGLDGWLPKPFTIDALDACLRQLLLALPARAGAMASERNSAGGV